jgi:hypothetical protein
MSQSDSDPDFVMILNEDDAKRNRRHNESNSSNVTQHLWCILR